MQDEMKCHQRAAADRDGRDEVGTVVGDSASAVAPSGSRLRRRAILARQHGAAIAKMVAAIDGRCGTVQVISAGPSAYGSGAAGAHQGWFIQQGRAARLRVVRPPQLGK